MAPSPLGPLGLVQQGPGEASITCDRLFLSALHTAEDPCVPRSLRHPRAPHWCSSSASLLFQPSLAGGPHCTQEHSSSLEKTQAGWRNDAALAEEPNSILSTHMPHPVQLQKLTSRASVTLRHVQIHAEMIRIHTCTCEHMREHTHTHTIYISPS